jgi:tetratricopeptide (TPR) repeat protein
LFRKATGRAIWYCIGSAVAFLSLSSEFLPAQGTAGRSTRVSSTPAYAKAQPDSVREAFGLALRAAAYASSRTEYENQIGFARQIAIAYSAAWSDPFFRQQVERFERSSNPQQRARVRADSLRRSGNDAMVERGIPAAMSLWRESLRLATTSGEPGVIAPALAAIGAGFYRQQSFDSATAYLRRAVDLASVVRDLRTRGNALGILASVAKDRGNPASAAALYQRASLIRQLSGDTRGLAADYNNLGLIEQERGSLKSAAGFFEQALELNRREKRFGLVALNLANLAGIAAGNGEYARAERMYREALTLHIRNGERAESGFIYQSLGTLYMSRGDYREAAIALENAIRIHEATGASLDAIAARLDLAQVRSAAGNPDSARLILNKAELIANRINASAAERAGLAIARGDLAMNFGTFAEAESEYSRAIVLYKAAHDSYGLARGLEGQAILLHWRGDDTGSMRLLAEAARTHTALGDRRSAAITNLILADVMMSRGDFSSTRKTLLGARQTLSSLGDAVGVVSALASLGDLALKIDSVQSAESTYRAALKRLGNRDAAELQWRLHTGLATALRKRGLLAEASSELRLAIGGMEKAASAVRSSERRSGFLADKWTAYTDLVLIEQARGRTSEAFAVSEQMRSRQMLDLLAQGRVQRASVASREEQDLRRRIEFLTRQLETSDGGEPRVREPAVNERLPIAVRRDLELAQADYARLLIRLRDADPAYATMVSGRTRSWREVSKRLKPDEVLLEYLITDSASTVFVVTADTLVAIDLRATRKDLSDVVEFSRKAIEKRPS